MKSTTFCWVLSALLRPECVIQVMRGNSLRVTKIQDYLGKYAQNLDPHKLPSVFLTELICVIQMAKNPYTCISKSAYALQQT